MGQPAGPEKIGRPRRDAFGPAEGIAHPFAAHAVAALDELTARHFDLIGDLPAEVLAAEPGRGFKSIAHVTRHMIWGEAGSITAATQRPKPAWLADVHGKAGYLADFAMAVAVSVCALIGFIVLVREPRTGQEIYIRIRRT